MKLENIYKSPINRVLNPAVSAGDVTEETVRIEIDEYVFTDEVINGLCRVLKAIRNREVNHTGVWVNGYYGSGKSHFLKYLKYCVDNKYKASALERLIEAVKERDPFEKPDSKCEVEIAEVTDLARWIQSAEIETILFNIEDYYNSRGNVQSVFTEVFFTHYNMFRGFNGFNITLAQLFEKKLADNGVFDEFKRRLMEDLGFDWQSMGYELAINEIDTVLDLAKELLPTLSTDTLRTAIEQDNYNISVMSLMTELQKYIEDKGDDYRLLFLVDEVSQFIRTNGKLLLELQSIVKQLNDCCSKKVWTVCTAQQDLSELSDACHFSSTSEDYGKIMGRFEVRVFLKSSQSDYITQKRILDKKSSVEAELGEMYNANKDAINTQFQLPSALYRSFSGREDFINYYPFIPYQFKLIAEVFKSFESLGYVLKEVKDNERSILKITHSTAKDTCNQEVGSFISFDQFYHEMFSSNLTFAGQRAIENANRMIEHYQGDKQFGQRLVNMMFMICNLSPVQQQNFPPTVDNFITLMMRKVDEGKLSLKNQIEEVLNYLQNENIIRMESKNNTNYFYFYSEDEIKVASLIKNTAVDYNSMADQYKDIFFTYLGNPKAKETYCGNDFTVGATIMNRNYLSNNPNIVVDFITESSDENADVYSLNNGDNHLAFFMAPDWINSEASKRFYWYCQAQKYIQNNPPQTESMEKCFNEFRSRAKKLLDDVIRPALHKAFDTCDIVVGTSVVHANELKGRGAERYREALQLHFAGVYKYATLCVGNELPKTQEDLRSKILRRLESGEYAVKPMSAAENEIEKFLNRLGHDVPLIEIIKKFSMRPHGWRDICTIYLVNELVRRNKRGISYNNHPNCERSVFAQQCVRTNEQSKFQITAADTIPTELVSGVADACREIFNTMTITPAIDATELYRVLKETDASPVNQAIKFTKEMLHDNSLQSYPFLQVIRETNEILADWQQQRDMKEYFKTIIAAREEMKTKMDQCKLVDVFVKDQLPAYREIRTFIDTNNDNFDCLSEEQQQEVIALKKIQFDAKPMDNFRTYIKAKKQVMAWIEDEKKELKKQIQEVYAKAFNDLDEAATQKGDTPRSVYADREATILLMQSANSIPVLKANILKVDDFFGQEIMKIHAYRKPVVAVPHPAPQPGDKVTPPAPEPVKTITPQSVSLHTRCIRPIENEMDVDAYLDGLREELLSKLSQYKKIIIK